MKEGGMTETTYPVGDRAYAMKQAKVPFEQIRATATGEYRSPKKGEWFLSGAIVNAYYAAQDLSARYPIARLVRAVRRTEYDILPLE